MKTTVITGCSTGLGRATALHLAERGWQVMATVRKEADEASLLAEAAERGCQERLYMMLCDITRADDVARLRQAVETATPGLDALINNAGTGFPGPLELLPLDDLRAQLEINLVAHVAVTQALLPALRRARGMILNVSSVGGRVAYPITGPYHMSKFALEAMSDALRVEVAPFGVRVVVIEPGSSPTPIWGTSLGRVAGDEAAARVGDYAPLAEAVRRAALGGARRGFPPEDFARLVERILGSRRPATRYVIPASVWFYILARRYLPDRVWDWIVRRALGW
jgi:NAD(P)-dependent dehydrogenase (short-subunit alcohol dehydrogenase family)